MDDIHKNIKDHNPNQKRKILIVFHDIITGMLSNKKPDCFYHTILFAVPKIVRSNSTQKFVMKIPNKRELQQFVFNH